MRPLIVIQPLEDGRSLSERLSSVKSFVLDAIREYTLITKADELHAFSECCLLFILDLGACGINMEYFQMLKKIREDRTLFCRCSGSVIVDGQSELYTKQAARELTLAANLAGCAFPGRPMVEATGSLENFQIRSGLFHESLLNTYKICCRQLLEQLMDFRIPAKKNPKLLVIHASNHMTSNTWKLWEMVKEHLSGIEIREISMRNGTLYDCSGCPYTVCMHFAENGQCCYGGVMVDEVYPALQEADALLMLCANYNDSISANLTAFINRLTALFRKKRFYDKYIFALIVSGYSGGDILASQLIGALNMNKSFMLPERFAMIETANDPESIDRVEQIHEKAAAFAAMMQYYLKHSENSGTN